jgi:uncharacterized protein YpbB
MNWGYWSVILETSTNNTGTREGQMDVFILFDDLKLLLNAVSNRHKNCFHFLNGSSLHYMYGAIILNVSNQKRQQSTHYFAKLLFQRHSL